MDRFVILSGCSGGGKSTLLEALRRRGHAVVDEPGRRIVEAETARGGKALPWLDMEAFLRRAVEVALADRAQAEAATTGWVFFDRGLVDAAAGLQALTGEPALAALRSAHRYHPRVFMTPPWPEIYMQDSERRHDLAAAEAEYARLMQAYPSLGYEVHAVPRAGVPQRADFVLNLLGLAPRDAMPVAPVRY